MPSKQLRKRFELYMQLDISYTSFVRTTSERHRAVVEALLATVWQGGDVYKAAYEGRYCVGCEEYKDAHDLDEEGRCLVHRTPCPSRTEVPRPMPALLCSAVLHLRLLQRKRHS